MIIAKNTLPLSDASILDAAHKVITIEAQALNDLTQTLDHTFVEAVRLLLDCKGRVVVSGMGKSGHIARKIAATFASTGTPAFFMHPAEAAHGDLGMITKDDVVVALSNSGKSEELLSILPVIKRHQTRLITMTGDIESPMAKLSDVHLLVKVQKEACPLNLAPTASTTAALALGDALAITLLESRGFSEDDFARSHPGGALGRRLLTYVANVMREGEDVPVVCTGTSLTDALLKMSEKRMGMTAVVDSENVVVGVLTDGDVRRLFEKNVDVRSLNIDDVMHTKPHTIEADILAISAVSMMEEYRINHLLVVGEGNQLVGALNIHDLFAAGVM